MGKFIKAIAVAYMLLIGLLAFLVPISAITMLAKLCGSYITWTNACIPIFITLGISPFVITCKILIDLTKER